MLNRGVLKKLGEVVLSLIPFGVLFVLWKTFFQDSYLFEGMGRRAFLFIVTVNWFPTVRYCFFGRISPAVFWNLRSYRRWKHCQRAHRTRRRTEWPRWKGKAAFPFRVPERSAANKTRPLKEEHRLLIPEELKICKNSRTICGFPG